MSSRYRTLAHGQETLEVPQTCSTWLARKARRHGGPGEERC